MHGCDSKDWDRFHRRMRAFGRMMERDMCRMGEKVEADMRAAGETRRGSGFGPGSAWMFDEDERAERRTERAERRAKRCGPAGLWAWWWVAFPVFFIGKNALEDAGGFAAVSAGAGSVWSALLQLSLIAPLAGLIADALQVSYGQAYGLLALSAIVCAGAALLGWRLGRPEAVSRPN